MLYNHAAKDTPKPTNKEEEKSIEKPTIKENPIKPISEVKEKLTIPKEPVNEDPVIERSRGRRRREEDYKTPEKENQNSDIDSSPYRVSTPDIKSMEMIFMDSIKKIISSEQMFDVKDFMEVNENGRVTWKMTHFIFVIDCSGSMRGIRWDSVKIGLKTCLKRMLSMKDLVISGFTFDNGVNRFCTEVTPNEAIKSLNDMKFTAKGTDYTNALEHAIQIITESSLKNYLSCILLLSDGLGGFPEDTLNKLADMKNNGTKLLFYTIACETDEDDDMIIMSKGLGGEHYKVTDPEASKIVFTKILGM